MTDLSPAARAVLDAYNAGFTRPVAVHHKPRIAAALRAAADQDKELEVPFAVVDEWEKIEGSCASFYAAAEWGRAQAQQELLAIAAELKGNIE